MARKRMFDNDIINQDSFLDLPTESKALYFLLGMEADDEGFVTPKRVMRLHNIAEDNLKVLIAKNYVVQFESGVVVITDWKRNNYLDKNKIKPTIYVDEKKMLSYDETKQQYALNSVTTRVKPKLNQSLTKVNQKLTQYSIEEYSIEENRIEENSIEKEKIKKEKRNELIELYNLYCTNLPKAQKLTDKRNKAIDKFKKEFTDEQIKDIFIIANKSPFLTGENDRGWKADIDFILRTDKAIGILEGKYNFKKRSGMDDFQELWQEAKLEDDKARDGASYNFARR